MARRHEQPRTNRGQRLLHLLSPRHQLECNPVMGANWIAAVACSLVGGTAAIVGSSAWQGFALIAGFLWMNAVMGSVCELFFGEYEPTRDRCIPSDESPDDKEL